MKKLLIAIMTLATMASCSQKGTKVLVLYYSQTGGTEAVAQEIASLIGADIEKFDVTEPYDGSYAETVARGQQEMADGVLPEIIPIKSNLDRYDTIFLGFPIWYGQPCLPLKALISQIDLSGKEIVPFCTFGSGGLTESTEYLLESLPDSYIMNGYGVRAARVAAAPEEVKRFLILNGYMEGSADAYDFFPEQHPCSEEETAIFNEATSGYQFPLGNAETASSRKIDGGMEYQFTTVENTTIYVNVIGGKAEFTRVDR